MLGINKIIPTDSNYPFMDYRKKFIIGLTYFNFKFSFIINI